MYGIYIIYYIIYNIYVVENERMRKIERSDSELSIRSCMSECDLKEAANRISKMRLKHFQSLSKKISPNPVVNIVKYIIKCYRIGKSLMKELKKKFIILQTPEKLCSKRIQKYNQMKNLCTYIYIYIKYVLGKN